MAGTHQDTLRLPSPRFAGMVNCGAILSSKETYPVKKGVRRKEKSASAGATSVRATISFPSDLYNTLEEIARKKKVSLAWVVRDAAEQYLAEKWPLFKGRP